MPKTFIATISGNAVEPISYHPQYSGSLRPFQRRKPSLQQIHEEDKKYSNPEEVEDEYPIHGATRNDRDSGISLDLYKHMPAHLVLPQSSHLSNDDNIDISLQEITTPGVQQENNGGGGGILVAKDPTLSSPTAAIDPHQVNSFLNDAKKHGFHVILSPELLGFITSQPRSHHFYHTGPEDTKNMSSDRSESLFDSAHGSDQTLPTSCDDSPPITKRVIFTHPLDQEGREYPYLREMRERLISEDDPKHDPQHTEARLLQSQGHGAPVGTVVKLNSDGYGSHTSPTHRVESMYNSTLERRPPDVYGQFAKNAKTSSFITLSMLYATLLVVVCIGFLLSEVVTHNVPLYYYEAFFTYLYGGSILFLLYVFCYLLTGSGTTKVKEPKKRKGEEAPGDENNPTTEKLTATTPPPKPRKTKISDNEHSHGSFFLRIGAIAFGLGTMIYNGLEFGVFLEIPMDSMCHMILRGVNPICQLVFTFMQMYFIFMNARLNIHKFKFVARFGLMHMVATNICVWIRTLVRESVKDINEFKIEKNLTGEDHMIIARHLLTENDTLAKSCGRVEIMGTLVSDSAPYLYPFIVEYSLIAACVLFIMWKHIGRSPKYVYDPELGDGISIASRRCQVKVDCIGASKGLFCGLLVLVSTLICLILFFVLVHQHELRKIAIYLADISHCAIMLLSIVAIFIGFCRVRHLRFHGEREEELDDILLMVSAFGLFAYAIFSAVAGSLSAYKEEPNLLVLITSSLSILQVIIQMVFIKDTQRRQVRLPEHERTKPGRQIITFLLICNLALWIVYTFETQKVESNPVQMNFFGELAWTIMLRCTIPLAIFHRFHSTVVLAAIWKNSYKSRIE